MPSRQPFQTNAPDPAAQTLLKALAHHQAGRLQDAERLYRAVLEFVPRHVRASLLLGMLYLQQEKPEQALPLLQTAQQTEPENPEILNYLALALRETGQNDEAIARWRQACEISPSYLEARTYLGDVFRDQNDIQTAFDYYEKVLGQDAEYVNGLIGMGTVLFQMQRPGDALAKFEYALKIKPNDAHAMWQKSLVLLAIGQYHEGWQLYEAGLGHSPWRGPNLIGAVKAWDGRPAPGKHLLIWCEQGFGDALQFIRYAELCKQRFAKVSVLCLHRKALVRLFKASPFIDDVFDKVQDGSSFDEHIPMMSLPHRFETVIETVPATVPYLRVDPGIRAKWASKFADNTAEMKVGLVWAGSAHKGSVVANHIDRRRSVGLERMTPWLKLQGVRFYNLQMDKPGEQIAALGLHDRITDFMREVGDFADTAAIVQNLDLVITVDTSVAHLAGGLGKPVWILSRFDADWRWLQNRPTNPWYPTARIFGQPSAGDWDSVIAEVGRELALEVAKRAR